MSICSDGDNVMLIDFHANPRELSPADFAEAVNAAGLDGVVIAASGTVDGLDGYVAALDTLGLKGFVGVECTMERGAFVFIPRKDDASFRNADWQGAHTLWTPAEIKEVVADLDGTLIATHPYCRTDEPPMGDRVYMVKGVKGIVTRTGKGQVTWDRLAEQAAAKKGAAQLGSSCGSPEDLGRAATSIYGEISGQSDLVDALLEQRCTAVEMDSETQTRDRSEPKPLERSDDRRDGRGRDGRRGRDDRRGGRERRPRR